MQTGDMTELGSQASLAPPRLRMYIAEACYATDLLLGDCSLSLHHSKPADPALALDKTRTKG
jgi:hypothetical protein